MKKIDDAADKDTINYSAEEEREMYKAAIQNVNINVFVYDVFLEEIYFFNSNKLPFNTLTESEYCLEEIENADIMDSENFDAFKALFKAMHNGKKEAEAVIKTIHDDKQRWNHVMLINYFNEQNSSVRAIGTIQDVSIRVETELRYSNEKQYRLAMLSNSNRVYEINVTRDRFIKLESIQDSTDCEGWALYTQSMANLCKTRVYKEDWDTFLKIASKENLLQGFEQEITEFYCEYRIVDESGKTSWSSSATHLLRDPLSEDIKGFIYVKDIDEQKRHEIELYQQAERDPLTGIYNRRTAERQITQLILSSGNNRIHGFLSMDIDEFKTVNDTFGHIKGDYLLQKISSEIGGILRNVDIFARMGGDEFIAFLNDVESIEDMLHVAERLCECVRGIVIQENDDMRVTLSVGVATYPKDGTTFAELYKKSDHALYEVKRNGKNNVAIYSGIEDK